jgi:hypothetical protein
MGWSEDRPRDATEPVQIIRPATIKSLWRLGLLEGDSVPTTNQAGLRTNAKGRALLDQIRDDTGIFLDLNRHELMFDFEAPADVCDPCRPH